MTSSSGAPGENCFAFATWVLKDCMRFHILTVAALSLTIAAPALAQPPGARKAAAAAVASALGKKEIRPPVKKIAAKKAAPKRPPTKKPAPKRIPPPKEIPPKANPLPPPKPMEAMPTILSKQPSSEPPPPVAPPQIASFDRNEGPQVTGLGRLEMVLYAKDTRAVDWADERGFGAGERVLGIRPDGSVSDCRPAYRHNSAADPLCALIRRAARFHWDKAVGGMPFTPPPFGYIIVVVDEPPVSDAASASSTPDSAPTVNWEVRWRNNVPDYRYPAPASGQAMRLTPSDGRVVLRLEAADKPDAARTMSMYGLSEVEIRIDRDLKVIGCTPTASSKSMLLDLATCAAVRARGRYEPNKNSAVPVGDMVIRQAYRWYYSD